ncbi:MAG: fibronectin type III domain-containing protein, partial [Flavobacteriia bacterium]
MQKEVSILKIKVALKTFSLNKRNSKVKILIFFIYGLFSNFAFSQLALQNFNSGIPSTWSVNSNQTVANNWSATTATGGYLGTPGAVVNPALNNTVGTTAEYFMITPQFITPQATEIRFYTKQGSFTNRGATYQLRLSTANQPDLNSFNVVLQTWTEAQLNVSATTYEEKIVNIASLPSGVPVYLAFVAITNQTGSANTSGDSWFVDNVRVIESCTPITGINSTMNATGGIINWTHPTATNFEIQIVPQGTGISATGTTVSGLSYTATGLTNGTNYDVYVRTSCDATTTSSWAGPYPVQTALLGLNCGTPIVIPSDVSTTPYVLNSNLANYFSLTDYTSYTTVGSNCYPSGTNNQLLGNHLFFKYTPTTTGLIEITQAVSVISGGGPNACYNASSSVMVYASCSDIGVNCLAAIKTGSGSTESLTSQISNFYVVAGQTYFIVMSSPYQRTATSNASICFTFTVSGSSCPSPAPSNTTYNNLTQTSANFSWGNVGNLVSSWQYVALPVSSGLPNNATIVLSTNTNTNNLVNSLIPNSDYNFFVRAVCNGVPGPWSAAVPFTTLCNVIIPPYYTGFTNSSETDCWTQLNLNNDLNFFTFGNSANSEPVARIRPQNSNDMLVSPQFQLDGVNQKRLRFKYNIYGNWGTIANNPTGGPGSFEIRLSTTGIGVNNFTTVLVPLTAYTTAYNFVEMIVPLPNISGNVNIAWVLPAGATQTGIQTYFDDVYIENLPACSEPSYPIVTSGSITSTSATISWTNGYNNIQWELVAQPLGTGIPTTPGIIVNTNPYTLTNLNPSTRYEFYMRAVCSSTVQSTWVGPINFNTLCIAQPTPYYESLNDADVNTKKFCWSVNNVDGGLTQWRIEATEASIRAASTMSQPFTVFDDWLISAPINAVGLKRLRFSHRAVNGIFNPTPRGNVEVLMSSSQDFSSYTVLIPSFDFVNLAYEEKSVLFTGTGTIYIAFRVPPSMTDPGNSGIMMIDDVYVEDAPPCPNPEDLAVSSITTSSANLTWAPGYLETQWQVVVQAVGVGIPTGTGTTVNTNPTFNATGLTQDTLYEYYVRAVCGSNGNSQWIGPFTFRTTCNVLSTTFLETFNSNSTTESCWRIVNGNGDTNDWNLNQTVNPIFGDQMAALFTGNNGNNNDWLISPTITVNPNQRLRFYYKVYDEFFEEDLKVMLSTNGIATNQFTTILYENSLNSFTTATGVVAGSNTITLASVEDAARVKPGDFIYIPGFPFPYPTYVATVQGTLITMTTTATITQTGVQNVQFEHEAINNEEVKEMVINLTGITVPTNINLAFHTPYFPANPWGYRGQYTFIDNVIVENIPACPSVINVTSSNLIDTAVTLNWEAVGTETSWEISVQPFGTPAPIGATLPQYLTTTNSHPKTISGLIPATQYQYYIRAICSSTSQSTWVGPFEFTTKCDVSNVCEYTITTISGNTGQVSQSVNVMQNGVVSQVLEFPGFGQTTIDYTVFLCSGVAFDLYWDGLGSGVQYSQAQIIIKDVNNNVIWTSPLGLGTVNTNIYSGFASCGTITCPQPTNLAISNQGMLSWNPGGTETQWEVFIQPVGNGTLPQSGIIVNTPNYTPVASNFSLSSASTYEYFVRAICSNTNKSYWSGPKVFIRNDEAATSVTLPVNSDNQCNVSGKDVSFIGATASSNSTTCSGNNGGDVWFDFIATSKVHTIELSDFSPGNYYTSSYEGPWPKIIMSLYEVQQDGTLIEKGCSDNNSFVAMYSSELIVGKTYKIRLKLDSLISNNKKFKICITTPTDLCDLDAFNYDFEKLPMQFVTGIPTIINALVVPGWRVNTVTGSMFFQEQNNSLNVTPYSGGQCVQLIQDGAAAWDPNDPNIKGLYKDFDTSEIIKMDYSFASATRSGATTVQLFAGPPSGPFSLVTEHDATSLVWELIQGSYAVPVGQNTTRFIFRTKGNNIGHILDAANFKANTDILTPNTTLDCTQSSINVQAIGTGEWIVGTSNPSAVTIANPTNMNTTISGINSPGIYIFKWKTRYCEKSITITRLGVTEVPTVTSPVIYCSSQTASELTASAPAGYTLLWFTDPITGTGTNIAPIPSTTNAGNTIYYVALVDVNACVGPRVPITVTVNATPVLPTATTPVLYCQNSTASALSATGTNLLWYTAATGGTGSTTAPTP